MQKEVKHTESGREVRELKAGLFTMPSFTSAAVYRTHPEGFCTCQHYAKRGVDTPKHQVTLRAILEGRKSRHFTATCEAALLDLCRRVFSPAQGYRESYELAVEVGYFRWASEELREWAWIRHRKLVDAALEEAA